MAALNSHGTARINARLCLYATAEAEIHLSSKNKCRVSSLLRPRSGLEAVKYGIVSWLLLQQEAAPEDRSLLVPTHGSVWLSAFNTCLGYAGAQNEVAIPSIWVRNALQDWVQREQSGHGSAMPHCSQSTQTASLLSWH